MNKIILILLLSFLLIHCQNNSEHSNKKVFRFNQSSGITSLDPVFAKDQANIWAVNQIFNGLVQLDDSLNVMPCIAKKWNVSKDGIIYTFYLRNDVYFHEHPLFKNNTGRKVTAHDFVYSFNRLVSKKVASPGAWIFNDKVVLMEDQSSSPWSGLKKGVPFLALDDTTFQIHLIHPFTPMLEMLSMQYCSVVPFEIAEHFKKEFRKNPIGTGPFKFKMWSEGVNLILLKNENYFEKDGYQQLPYIDAVSVLFITDKHIAFLEFIKGNLDFFSGIDDIRDNLLTKDGAIQSQYSGKFKMDVYPFLNTEYLGILIDDKSELVKNHPLRLKQIRQAINYGIDRKKMITYLRNNLGTPATAGFIPIGIPSYDSLKVKGYDYNPEKSKQLLKEVGYPGGKDLPSITLCTNPGYKDLCEFIQNQLSEIGITLNINIVQPATLREIRDKSQVNFFRSSWIADYSDAENYLALFYSKNFCPNGPNFTHFKSVKFDSLYELAKSEKNQELRHKYYQQMDQIVMDESPVIVLYYDKVVRLTQNNISNLGINALNLLSLKRINIDNNQSTVKNN